MEKNDLNKKLSEEGPLNFELAKFFENDSILAEDTDYVYSEQINGYVKIQQFYKFISRLI